MAQNSVPLVAAQWIASVLRPGQDTTLLVARLQQFGGLRHLLVKDLKKVYRAMERKQFVCNSPWGLGSLSRKKADLIAMIRRYFYEDCQCTVPNQQAVQELQQELSSQPAPAPAPVTTSAPRTNSLHHSYGYAQHPTMSFPNHFQSRAFSTASLPAPMHFPFSSPTGDRKRNHSLSFAPPQTQPQISHVHVKLEVGAAAAFSPLAPAMNAPNDDRQPKTATEMHLLSQLRDMGFTSSTEVLESIRRLTSESAQPPSIDTVMIDIISQREEAEEAKKMDEARLQSEQARKEDARRRREVIEKTLQESIKSASLDDWRRNANMFLDSWLLAGDACYLLEPLMNTSATLKEKLVALLKLEKKARKWYGAVLPRGYFAERVTKRLQEESTVGAVSELLQEEVDTLEVAMFTLSEQKGGVPRIFLEAHDEASALDSSLQTGESGEDIDDDVVVVVLANKANSTRLSEKSTPEAAPEILEIL